MIVHKNHNKVIRFLGIHHKSMDENYIANIQRKFYVLAKIIGDKEMIKAVLRVIETAFNYLEGDVYDVYILNLITNKRDY